MSNQLKTLSLRCPSCGATLDVTPELDRFACGYCGTEQIVQRQGGTVALKLLGDAIARVQYGTDRTAAELALRRLRDDLAAIEQERLQFNAHAAKTVSEGQGAVVVVFVVGIGLCVVLMGSGQTGFGLAAFAAGIILPVVTIASNSSTRDKLGAQRTKLDNRHKALCGKIDEQRKLLDPGNT